MATGDRHDTGPPDYVSSITQKSTYHHKGECIDDGKDGANCYNDGLGYNGGHPCARGCGCHKLNCDGSDNFLADNTDLYVPHNLYVDFAQAGNRTSARSAMKSGTNGFYLKWSNGAWRGTKPCKSRHSSLLGQGTEKNWPLSSDPTHGYFSLDPCSYTTNIDGTKAECSYSGNSAGLFGGNTLNQSANQFGENSGKIEGRSDEVRPRRTEFHILDNSFHEKGFCWHYVDSLDADGNTVDNGNTEILPLERGACLSANGCWEPACVVTDDAGNETANGEEKGECSGVWKDAISGTSKQDCGGSWVEDTDWQPEACIIDGVKPPRKQGRCLLHRIKGDEGFGAVDVPVKVVTQISAGGGTPVEPDDEDLTLTTGSGIVIEKDTYGRKIETKYDCELAGGLFTEEELLLVIDVEGVIATVGEPPYGFRWEEGDYDESYCCSGRVITNKSAWFTPIARKGISSSPTPGRETLGFCYSPSEEVILIPSNISMNVGGCVNFQNQSDRILAKDGYYEYASPYGKIDSGAYTLLYKGCDYYDDCPQTEDLRDTPNPDPHAQGRQLTLFIPQNQMLNVANLNLTLSETHSTFDGAYAGWDSKMAKFGNPAPWSAWYPSWPTTFFATWPEGDSDICAEHDKDGYDGYYSNCGVAVIGSGPLSSRRNPAGNRKLNAFNLQAQPFKASEERSAYFKTLTQALNDQKAHSKCFGSMGSSCAWDVDHGVDYWFSHDFNYADYDDATCRDRQESLRLALLSLKEGRLKCGSCGSGPWAYISWFPYKLPPNEGACQSCDKEDCCDLVGWCEGSSSGPCHSANVDPVAVEGTTEDDPIDVEWGECDQDACQENGGSWHKMCEFTPDEEEDDDEDGEPPIVGEDEGEDEEEGEGTCAAIKRTSPACESVSIPSAIRQIVWGQNVAIQTVAEQAVPSLNYWKETGLMPFNNITPSYVDDTCYGGSLSGSIEKATNTSPIIIYSKNHKLRPGDEIDINDVVGNFKANTYTLAEWYRLNYEDKRSRGCSDDKYCDKPYWPKEKLAECVVAPVGGWPSEILMDKYGYFTVCGLTAKTENMIPTADTFALCDCKGIAVDGLLTKGTNLPSCLDGIDLTMKTCVDIMTRTEQKVCRCNSVEYSETTERWELVDSDEVDISCSGDTTADRIEEGREDECKQTCLEYGQCMIVNEYYQKYDNDGNPIRTGSDHAVCQDCLEGTAQEYYGTKYSVMTKDDCNNLARFYKTYMANAPDSSHYPASDLGTAECIETGGCWQEFSWDLAESAYGTEGAILVDAWKSCPFTGRWDLHQAREDSNLIINEEYNTGETQYINTIPVSGKQFLGGFAYPGDLLHVPPQRTDLANDWYVHIEQDGFCGGCEDHYIHEGHKTLYASVTEGQTSDLAGGVCGYKCDGTVWWDGYCCDCDDDFETVVLKEIADNCGGSSSVRMIDNGSVWNGCAYGIELGIRKKMCNKCGCTYRIDDPVIDESNTDPCCNCECINEFGDEQPTANCEPAHPVCETVERPTIETFSCCKPPSIACDDSPDVGGVGEGGTVTLGGMTCTCKIISEDPMNPDMKIWGYHKCEPCTGFPDGRPLECLPDPICCNKTKNASLCEDFCQEAPETTTSNGMTCLENLDSSGCNTDDIGSGKLPLHCTRTGGCRDHSGCKGLGGLDFSLNWNGSSWDSDWVLMNDVGMGQCKTYEKDDKCKEVRCVYLNGTIEIGINSQSFKDGCEENDGDFQIERTEQPIPGADCGGCSNRYFGGAKVLTPGNDGHFMRLSFGCGANINSGLGTTQSTERLIGFGFLGGQSYYRDQMNLAMEITTCSIRPCTEGSERPSSDGQVMDFASRPPAITGIGCIDFDALKNESDANKLKYQCVVGCQAPENRGPEYPCTGCCDFQVRTDGEASVEVCAGTILRDRCATVGTKIISERNQLAGRHRKPEYFTVHSVDIDEDGERGYDILHVDASHLDSAQKCAWEPSAAESAGYDIKVGIGMADKQAAESGTHYGPHKDASRNMLSASPDWPQSTKLLNAIPALQHRDKTYLEIHVESASVLMSKASSINRELEIREDATGVISDSTVIDGGGNYSRKGGGSDKKKYRDLDNSSVGEHFVGLDLTYNSSLPYPYGRNPWPVGVQSTPTTPSNSVLGLQSKLERFRISPTVGVPGRVGLIPTAAYLNYREDMFDDPNWHPYEDIEIEEVYNESIGGGKYRTVVVTSKPHDLISGEKVIISDSICWPGTCKGVPSEYCRNKIDAYFNESDPSHEIEIAYGIDQMECMIKNNFIWEWHTEFKDADINAEECAEKGGEWIAGVRNNQSVDGEADTKNENPDPPHKTGLILGCPPHCEIVALTDTPIGGGACHPDVCEWCFIIDVEGQPPQNYCPRCPWDGSHIAVVLSSSSFALYSEAYIHYEDFEASVRISDPKKEPDSSNTDDYIDWVDNFDPSVNWVCEEAYPDLEEEDLLNHGLCKADPRCVPMSKGGAITCVSKNICENIDYADEGSQEQKEFKRNVCNSSNHCIAETKYGDDGIDTVKCIGREAPNVDSSSRNISSGLLSSHFPGHTRGAEIGIGEAKQNLMNGAVYNMKPDPLLYEDVPFLDRKGRWSRHGGTFEIGVGLVPQIKNLHQDFSGLISENYSFSFPDTCCNHKYPPIMTSCGATCDPGGTSTIGEGSGTIVDDSSLTQGPQYSAAIINVSLTEAYGKGE